MYKCSYRCTFMQTFEQLKVKMPSFHYCKGFITPSSTLGKIEQMLHQSDIKYISFAATSLIHPYMTKMTKMLNAFCFKRCTWCWFATKPRLFCKGHYITLLGPAWGKIVNNPVWFEAVCCLDGLMLPVHYKRRKMKMYTRYSLQRTGTADRHTVILD